MLDGLVPDTDKIPETVRITFLQRAVQQNHDLRQNHVLDSIWKSEAGSTGKHTFEIYYHLLRNAAYQHNLNKYTGQKQRKAFISHPVDYFDETDHEFGEDNFNDSEEDDPSSYSFFQSSFNSTEPKKHTKVFILYQIQEDFPEAAKQMIIDYNKKMKVPNLRPHFIGGNTQQNSTLGQSNPQPQQVHCHKNDHPPDNSSTETSTQTQTMVHECLSMVEWTHLILTMSCQLSRPRLETHLKSHQENQHPSKICFW